MPTVDSSFVQTTANDHLVGRSLEGRYRILEPIARGGMSTVYAAVDERLDRLVAVKVMSAALSADPNFSDRFAREARAAARLTHLNTVSVYDQGHEVGPDGHHVFLVMELVEGRTLRELLRERGRLAPAEAVSIMEPVLSALSAAHRAGLVHRDVKPENILLSDDGVVKVADFGLARAVETDISSTRTGLMMGTVAYCAPEQISHGSADPRSDVYSAGVVFFELLTGTAPYRGESAMNVAYQHVHSRVPAPSSRVSDNSIPTEIDELVVAATDSDPTARPADAAAFLAEIADLRTALRLPVMPVPGRPRNGRPARANQRPPAGGPHERRGRTPDRQATVGINSDAARHDTTIDAARAPGARPAGGPPRPPVVIGPHERAAAHKRRQRRMAIIIVVVLLLVGAAVGYTSWYYASGRYAKVPILHGASQSDAVSKLEDAGYRVKLQPGPEWDETVTKGKVLRTEPAGGARVVKGRQVVLVLSAGPHYYAVKQVAGKTPEEAKRILQSVGPVQVADKPKAEHSDTTPNGQVTRTSPAAGTHVTRKQPITIYYSIGPPTVDVPNISPGTPLSDAKATLKKAKFDVATEERFSDTIQKGTVVSVSPAGHALKFSTVTITVSKGPENVQVPDISLGDPVDDVKTALTEVGLVPDVKVVDGSDSEADKVLTVSPAAGSTVPVGTVVTVYAYPG